MRLTRCTRDSPSDPARRITARIKASPGLRSPSSPGAPRDLLKISNAQLRDHPLIRISMPLFSFAITASRCRVPPPRPVPRNSLLFPPGALAVDFLFSFPSEPVYCSRLERRSMPAQKLGAEIPIGLTGRNSLIMRAARRAPGPLADTGRTVFPPVCLASATGPVRKRRNRVNARGFRRPNRTPINRHKASNENFLELTAPNSIKSIA